MASRWQGGNVACPDDWHLCGTVLCWPCLTCSTLTSTVASCTPLVRNADIIMDSYCTEGVLTEDSDSDVFEQV